MRLILDTCAILWLASDYSQLRPKAVQAIRNNADFLYVSAISAFEISLKSRKGKLSLKSPPEHWWAATIALHGLQVLPVTDEIALASTALPTIHADPCDRIIIATAVAISARIVTSDEVIPTYPQADVLWD